MPSSAVTSIQQLKTTSSVIVIEPGEVYSIQHYVIKFVIDFRQVGGFPTGTCFYQWGSLPLFSFNKYLWVFHRYSGFLHQYKLPLRYNWNIVEVALTTLTLTLSLMFYIFNSIRHFLPVSYGVFYKSIFRLALILVLKYAIRFLNDLICSKWQSRVTIQNP